MRAVFTDGKLGECAIHAAFEHADSLAVVRVPVCDLAIAAARQDLALIGVEDDGFERGGLEEAERTHTGFDVLFSISCGEST